MNKDSSPGTGAGNRIIRRRNGADTLLPRRGAVKLQPFRGMFGAAVYGRGRPVPITRRAPENPALSPAPARFQSQKYCSTPGLGTQFPYLHPPVHAAYCHCAPLTRFRHAPTQHTRSVLKQADTQALDRPTCGRSAPPDQAHAADGGRDPRQLRHRRQRQHLLLTGARPCRRRESAAAERRRRVESGVPTGRRAADRTARPDKSSTCCPPVRRSHRERRASRVPPHPARAAPQSGGAHGGSV